MLVKANWENILRAKFEKAKFSPWFLTGLSSSHKTGKPEVKCLL